MIKGTFNIFEFIAVAAGSMVMLFGGVLSRSMGFITPGTSIFLGMMIIIAMLFVRPLWFLANKRHIHDWEHVTATVEDVNLAAEYHSTTKFRMSIMLRFKDVMGNEHHETFVAPAFMREASEGDEYEIAFDSNFPDRLIVLEPARKQVKIMTITGIVLEAAAAILWFTISSLGN